MRWLAGLILAAATVYPIHSLYKANGTGAISRGLADKLSDTVSVKDYGAKGDGSTDDTVALQNAMTAFVASPANTLDFGSGTYLISNLPDNGHLATFTGLTKKRFVGQGAIIRTTQFATGTVVSAATWDGTKFTLTTSTPHGYTNGQLVGIYNATPIQLNGYYNITVLNSTQFTYVPVYVPTGFVFGAATTQATNYNIRFLEFLSCTDITVSGLRFEGTVVPNTVDGRLGLIGVYALHGLRFNVDITTHGLAYGVLMEFTDSVNVKVVGDNTGYGAAYSTVTDATTFVNIDTGHRGVYHGGVQNSRTIVLSKNEDITGVIITNYDNGDGTHYPTRNLTVDYTDTGTTLPESHGGPSVIGVLISGYSTATAPVTMENVSVRFGVTEVVNGIHIRPYVFNTFDHYIYNGFRVSGYHDKTVQTAADRTLEFLPSTGAVFDTSIVNGIDVHDMVIRDPASFTAGRYWFSNLAANVRFTNYIGEAIDPAWVNINAGAGLITQTPVLVAGTTTGIALDGSATTGIAVRGIGQGTTSTAPAILGNNTGTAAAAYGVYGNTASNGGGAVGVYGNYGGTDGASAGVRGEATTGFALQGIQDGVGIPLQLLQKGATTSRPVAEVHRTSAGTGTGPIIQLWDESAGGTSPLAEFKGQSAASAAKNISTWKTGAVLAGYVQVMVNGVAQWMPYYSAPTGP